MPLKKASRPWSPAEDAYLQKYYLTTNLDVLAAAMDRSIRAIQTKANGFALKRHSSPVRHIFNDKDVSLDIQLWTRKCWASYIKEKVKLVRKNNTARIITKYDKGLVESFRNFVNCVGYAPTVDHRLRLHDRTKGYVPGNIYWLSKAECQKHPAFVDLTGKRFGRWLVIGARHIKTDSNDYWVCQCDCGTIRHVQGKALKYGKSKGCQKCGARFRTRKPVPRDGIQELTAYQCWEKIYKRWWSGKEIKGDEELLRSFKPFSEEIGDMPSPTCRIKLYVPSRGYIRGNLYWEEETKR